MNTSIQTQSLSINAHFYKIASVAVALFAALFLFTNTAQAGQSWQKQDFKVKGTWAIEQRSDGNYLVLDDAFKTKKAPDLKFFLSKNSYQDINGNNATSNAVQIAVLKSVKGGASYKIPANVNVADYKSLVLHCEQYSKLWASTPLK